ncbi:GNAT family N-acetyltransferase [Mycoplasmatota bacterium]|nr:GNAT family N-acetyltransferase [Mycoplasmatota bacterium]
MLYQLNQTEYHKVKHLAKDICHNQVVVNAVVDGMSPGVIFVDDINLPKSALIYPKDGFYYIFSTENHTTFFQSLNQLFFEDWKVDILELFIYPEQLMNDLSSILGKKKYIMLNRNEYQLNENSFKKVNVKNLEPNLQLKKITKDLINEFDISIKPWMNEDFFLNHGLGYCIIKEKQVISKCITCYRHKNLIEIGIDTIESYQKQGFASIVCQTLITESLKRNFQVMWSCWDFNEASNILAKKMGFEFSNHKKVVIWDHYIDKE